MADIRDLLEEMVFLRGGGGAASLANKNNKLIIRCTVVQALRNLLNVFLELLTSVCWHRGWGRLGVVRADDGGAMTALLSQANIIKLLKGMKKILKDTAIRNYARLPQSPQK